MIGRLILINFGTQLIVDALAIKFVDKIGYRISIVIAHLFCAAGLAGLGILPYLTLSPYRGLMGAVIIYAIGGGLIEVLVSPIVDSIPGDAKASAMSLLHSFYCWGQVGVVLISTLFIKMAGSHLWYVLPVVWAAVPAYNFFKFMYVPLAPTIPEHEKISAGKLMRSKLFLVALILMMCAGASEQAMSQWSSLFAEKGLQVPKIIGDLLGPCLFALLMGTGRTVYGVLGHRIQLKKALFLSGILCAFCYLVTAFMPVPVISLLSCALCGFAVSLMWPGVFSLTSRKYPGGGTAMFGMLAIFGDLGCSVGPWVAGIISDTAQRSSKLIELGNKYALTAEQTGLKTGIFAAAVFPLLMILGLALFTERNIVRN